MRIQKQEQRQMIVTKALEYVKNGTYKNLSIRDFCAEVGITTGIFYRHFASKEALFHDCGSQLLEEELSTVDVLLFGLSCEEQLIRYALFLFSFSRKIGQDIISIDSDNPDNLKVYQDYHNMAEKYAIGILLHACSDHLIDEASVPIALESFFVIVEGIYLASFRWKDDKDKALLREEQLLRRLIPGILKNPEQ